MLYKRYVIPAILAVIIAAFGIVIHDMLMFESTDDAYVDVTTVQVAPKVSGQIIEVMVKDNQRVKENDFVAQIDPIDYKLQMQQASARYERALSNQKNARANFDVANADLIRYKNLYASGAVSKQTLDAAQAKFTNADEALLSKGGGKVADLDIKELKALKEQAELNYSRTSVQAPISGTVTNRRVEKGMLVAAGTPLFTIVPDEVWITANFKENQIRHMKPGQEVEIKVDTYPDKVFKGKIDSIQRSSGAKSSLFPPENAVGSFVKIVQRIPVKIVFTEKIDPDVYTIVPGMSVVPKVKVK
ncbi:MAG: HlyD family secretion protein [Heliobacteriaceae bacterium]|jgi:membrane fusion protein (multidrug efflux system)|nr:HlyD family secretion protein [Heliobacteriaceae bacterium]